MKKTLLAVTAAAMILGACSHTEKVAVVQPGDTKLSCAEIQTEFDDMQRVMREAKKNKGASGANIAAAVFFWPAAVGNYVDAKDAEELVQERQRHLTKIADNKGC